MPRKDSGFSSYSFDQELKAKLIAIGEKEIEKKLGKSPKIPDVVRFLVIYYLQSKRRKS